MFDAMSYLMGLKNGGGGAETPVITVDADGLITAQSGEISATHQLSNADDADFVAGNIKSGVEIFGATGSLEPAPTPPTKGFVPTAWDSKGWCTDGIWYGTEVTSNTFYTGSEAGFFASLSNIDFADNVTVIGSSAFSGCTSLALTFLPNSVVDIKLYAFSNCNHITFTSLPSSVTSIGNYAFNGCTGLALTSIPSSIETLGQSCFYNCKGLTELTFLGTPTSIASNAFNKCVNLTVINVPWAEGAVANAPWGATNATINYNYTS